MKTQERGAAYLQAIAAIANDADNLADRLDTLSTAKLADIVNQLQEIKAELEKRAARSAIIINLNQKRVA